MEYKIGESGMMIPEGFLEFKRPEGGYVLIRGNCITDIWKDLDNPSLTLVGTLDGDDWQIDEELCKVITKVLNFQES